MQDQVAGSALAGQPSARGLRRRLIATYLVITAVAVMLGCALFFFGLDLTIRQVRILAAAIPVAAVSVLVADILVITIHFRPLDVFLRALQENPAAGILDAALVRALNLPSLTVLRIMLVHIPSFSVPMILVFLWGNRYVDLGLHIGQMGMAVLLVTFVAVGHAVVEYYAVHVAMRPLIRLLWSRRGEPEFDHQHEVIPVGMRRKLLVVSATVVFVPLFVLGSSVLAKVNRLLGNLGIDNVVPLVVPLRLWTILVIAGSMVIMLFISIMMAREIARSANEMMWAMRQVRNEEFDVRLQVTTTDEFAALYRGFNRMTGGLQERERLRDAFGRYVAPELAEQVMRHGVALGGETVRASVLFADIRGFTALSGQMTPPEVVALLNRYFKAVEPAIRAEGGWINKFGGDSLLAVFGAPVPQADHAERAVRAAAGIRAALAEFNAQQREMGQPALRIGIGIDCGEMVAGSVGSPNRMEYTVIGDVVNIASRIEGLNKQWGTDVLISAEACAIAETDLPLVAMPPAVVQGKSEPIQVFALQ